MNISVLNLSSKKVSRKELKFVTGFYARLIMSDRLCDTLTIVISFVDMEDKGRLHLDEDDPRKFLIEIDKKFSKRLILRILGHEMAHVKQYAKGELKDFVDSSSIRFRDKIYDGNEFEVPNSNYYFSPWEIDANGLEEALYRAYLEMKKKEKQK